MKWLKKSIKLMALALILNTATFSLSPAMASTNNGDNNIKNLTDETKIMEVLAKDGPAVYPIGQPNTAYAQYFTGRSFLYQINNDGVSVANVTFEPGSINFWHKHHNSCQVLAGVSGKGYYQIWGENVKEILPGTSVVIPENVKHWHGAQHDSWFQHLAIMNEGASTEWLEPVNPEDYNKLK